MITDYFHQFFQSDTWPFVGVIALVIPIIILHSPNLGMEVTRDIFYQAQANIYIQRGWTTQSWAIQSQRYLKLNNSRPLSC
jgi:hypothetical protein